MSNAPILKDCPFCGRKFGKDLSDIVYPTGTVWTEKETEAGMLRSYHSRRDMPEYDGQCFVVVCQEHMWGCGAEISGDSFEEAVAKWNTRV